MATVGDKLATRITLMLQTFNNGARLTVEEMAEEYGVDVRTIQRDVRRLSFLPIEKEYGRYFLAPYALGKLSFGDIQAFSHISGIGNLYPKLDENTIIYILNPKTNKALKIKGADYENLSHSVDMFDMLGGAILSQHIVSFNYKNKNRKVKPYKLYNTQGIWYLIALDGNTIKHFTFSKIEDLCVVEESFSVNDDVVDKIEESSLTWMTKNPISIQLRIDAEVAEYFLQRSLLAEQTVLEETEEYIMVSAT